MSTEENPTVAYLDITVRYGRENIDVSLPLAPNSSTIGELKKILEQRTLVPYVKQRLLFNAPIMKEFRRDADDAMELRVLLPNSFIRATEAHTGGVAQHFRVTAMLLGSRGTAAMVDSKTSSEISRLVSTTLEFDGQWYRCCYGKGYLRQTAYVCRTCVKTGRADAAHAVCLACAEICHGNHEVEEWGVRHFMRCDCCTKKCWRPTTGEDLANDAMPSPPTVGVVSAADLLKRTQLRKRSRSNSPGSSHAPSLPLKVEPHEAGVSATNEEAPPPDHPIGMPPSPRGGPPPVGAEKGMKPGAPAPVSLPEASRCMFIVDSATNKPPVSALLPVNRKNRYPRSPTTWCYCERDYPNDSDYGGVVCMLCTTCFWSAHITRLFADQYRYMPCYGDVLQGNVLAFKCNTCNTYVCTPCRLRCHKDHAIEPGFVIPDHDDGATNGASPGVKFSCGCAGLCSIAERVPEDEVDHPDLYMPMPDDVRIEMMNSDVFMGMVCAHCMQEYPWLMQGNPKHCYEGRLPPKVTTGLKPVVACNESRPINELPSDVFPYHGMLLPVNSFTAEATCRCAACRRAYEEFAPRAEDATEMIIALHDHCDNCGVALENGKAFLCRTCEMTMEETFFICKACNALREARMLEEPPEPPESPQGKGEEDTDATNASTHGGSAGGAATGSSSRFQRPHVSVSTSSPPTSPHQPEGEPDGTRLTAYNHDLSHEFVEDTFENLISLCQMQVLQTIDEPSRQYVEENFEDVTEGFSLTNTLAASFAQMPLNFDEEDMQALEKDNVSSPCHKNPEK
ncbi:unnamed protein product [Phytomonas sp. EM1]|nr:unnamed protein product [Phytomonas sp. EM1]|eukprot:CCW62364.1 unnamed protein product [Phytomonas sp. isolate EM1]